MSSITSHLLAVTNAKSVEDLWSLHLEKMASYGFNRLIYGFTRYITSSSLGDPQDWLILTNMKPEYMEVFAQSNHQQHAPMVRWALENDGACSWRWLEDLVKSGRMTEKEMAVMAFNAHHEVSAGYTISFRSVSERTKGAIALIGKQGMSQDEIEDVWSRVGDDLIVANSVFHLKLLTLPYTGARRLTSRQREVLQWVGDGKTTQDIAILLELTPATVEKHLRLARDALDVETTAQAVLKAAFYNQMFVIDL